MSNYPDFSELNYQVISELGRNREGGRISYLAECLKSEQKVVIKQFRFVQSDSSWQGFKAYEREIDILQELEHPRIPRYLDSFETKDGFCMVQEYKDAPSLASRHSFTPKQVQEILISLLEILEVIQKRVPPIIHRDIKPENILVDQENNAYLIDFGLARANSQEIALSSVVAGTPGFMPPEELFNRPLTTGSDLYSLGATAIALLTNTSSVKISELIDESYQFRFRHLITGINQDFIAWLQKMVAPNPKARYPNAAEALKDLRTIDITKQATTESKSSNFKFIAAIAGLVAIMNIAIFSTFKTANTSTPKTTTKPVANKANTSTYVSSEQKWFQRVKPNCNSLEVMTTMARKTYPQTPHGIGYAASCYMLAGKLDLADRLIQELAPKDRYYAAQVLFHIGHPVADAGDDKSAGEIMDLVLKYWPNNYMALYHAGMSAYVLGDYPKAKNQLNEFIRIYQRNDSWTGRANLALSRIEQNIPADKSFSQHH